MLFENKTVVYACQFTVYFNQKLLTELTGVHDCLVFFSPKTSPKTMEKKVGAGMAMGGHAGGSSLKRKSPVANDGSVCNTCGKSSKRTKAMENLSTEGEDESDEEEVIEVKRVLLTIKQIEKAAQKELDDQNPILLHKRINKVREECRRAMVTIRQMRHDAGTANTEMESCKAELVESRAKLGRRIEKIATLKAETVARAVELEEKKTLLVAKNTEISRRGHAQAGQGSTIIKQGQEISRMAHSMKAKDTELARREQTIVAKDAELAHMRNVISSQEDVTQGLRLQLVQARTEAAAKAEQFRDTAALLVQVSALTERNDNLEENAADERGEMATLRTNLQAADTAVRQMQALKLHATRRVVSLTRELQELAEELTETQRAMKQAAVVVKVEKSEIHERDLRIKTLQEREIPVLYKELASRGERIWVQTVALNIREGKLTEMFRDTASLTQAGKDRDGQLATTTATLQLRDGQLATTIATLRLREEELATTTATLRLREEELAESAAEGSIERVQRMQGAIRVRDASIATMRNTLRQREFAVTEGNALLATSTALLDAKEALLADINVEISEKDAALSGKDALLQAKDGLLAVKDGQLMVSDQARLAQETESQEIRRKLDSAEKDLVVKDAVLRSAHALTRCPVEGGDWRLLLHRIVAGGCNPVVP